MGLVLLAALGGECVPSSPATARDLVCDVLRVAAVANADTLRERARLHGLRPNLFTLAWNRAVSEWNRDQTVHSRYLTIIDYSLPSTEKRLWVLDRQTRTVVFHEFVAHAKKTGANVASRFGNGIGDSKTSLGLYKTGDTYQGHNGYSMRMIGIDRGLNHNAAERNIVLHGASYVSEDFIRRNGRLGRSLGCFAVRKGISRALIDTVKGGTLVYAGR